MYFRFNEFEVGVNDSIFSGNEQQKVYSKYVAHRQQNVSKFVLKCSKVVLDRGFTFKNPQLGINLYFTFTKITILIDERSSSSIL